MKSFFVQVLEKIQDIKDMILSAKEYAEKEKSTDEVWYEQTETLPIQTINQSHHHESPALLHTVSDYRQFWIIGLVVITVGRFLMGVHQWVLLVFTGVVISIAIESLITYLEIKTKRRRLGITLSYLLLVGLLLSGVLVMIPFLINQLSDIVSIIVNRIGNLETSLKTTGLQPIIKNMRLYGYLKTFGIDLATPIYLEQLQSILQNNISAIISFSSSYAKNAGSLVVSTVWGILSTLVQIGFVLTLSILLSIEKNGFVRFIYKLSGYSPQARAKLTTLYKKLWFWLKTQLLLGLFIGIIMRLSLVIMWFFGIDIPNKWSLAVISALTELIPYLGPTLGGIPIVIMASISNGWLGLLVAGIVVFAVQWIENNILIPLLFKQNLGVSPVLIFLCMVIGGITMGINGVILAIPIAVIITILLSSHNGHGGI